MTNKENHDNTKVVGTCYNR